jgi:cell division protein DivIC
MKAIKLPKIFYSKIFLILVLVVLLGVFALELQQWQQRRKIDAEISHLKQEQAELESRNNALEQSLQYFSSDSYKEKLAREQLGLKKEGEIVINYPPGGTASDAETTPEPVKSNPQKWWEYIFQQS